MLGVLTTYMATPRKFNIRALTPIHWYAERFFLPKCLAVDAANKSQKPLEVHPLTLLRWLKASRRHLNPTITKSANSAIFGS